MLPGTRHTPEGGRPAAERQFIDREELVAPVRAALREPHRTSPLVLVYFGGAGIGKSRLRRELVRQMAADHAVLTATLDFALPVYRQPDTALFFLRQRLGEAYQVRFASFDLAYAVLWQKTHPDTTLRSEEAGERGEEGLASESGHKDTKTQVRTQERGMQAILEPGSLLSQVLDGSGKLPLNGLIPRISSLLSAPLDASTTGPLDHFLHTWWTRRGEHELAGLPQLGPDAIVGRLPALWSADLRDALRVGSSETEVENSGTGDHSPFSAPRSRSAVLFIDSYEKLWETGDTRQEAVDSRQATDEWVRVLVKQLPEALWVVCGRQKLRWEEVDKDWGASLSQHELSALPDQSARRFLASCGITSEPIQDAIVKGSQGVPHYLDLAVDTTGSSESQVPGSGFEADRPEEVTRQFVRHLDQPEIEALQVLSAPRFWYYELFENLMAEYQTGYPVTAYNDLARFSFVKEGAAPGTRTMHDLMREALQEEQSPELRKRVHLFLHELYAKQLEGLDVKNITEKHRAALNEAFYHGRQAMSAAELLPWFKAAVMPFDRAGQFRLLTPLHRELRQALESELGADDPGVAEIIFRLATELHEQGEYVEAEPLYRRALAILQKERGVDRSLVCTYTAWLGRLLRNLGRYDEAESVCRQALALFDEAETDQSSAWDLLNNLAAILIESGKLTAGEVFARRALGVSEKGFGPNHSHTADSLNTLAYVMMRLSRFGEAEPLFRRALAIRLQDSGPNCPDVVIARDNLGVTLQNLCRYAEAESLHRQALSLSEETLGPAHPDTAVVLNHLGTALLEQGQYDEAEAALRRALTIFEKKVGLDHPNPTVTAGHLVSVLVLQGRCEEAAPMALAAVATCEKRFGANSLVTKSALHRAGVVCTALGRYTEAEEFLRRELRLRTMKGGPENPDTLACREAMASLEQQRGNYSDAESICRDVLNKQEGVLEPGHPRVACVGCRLAGLCARDGRHAEAEALYRRALAIREKVFGPDHPFVAEVLDGLCKVCEQTGRAAETQELAYRAKTIRRQTEPAPDRPRQQA